MLAEPRKAEPRKRELRFSERRFGPRNIDLRLNIESYPKGIFVSYPVISMIHAPVLTTKFPGLQTDDPDISTRYRALVLRSTLSL